MLLSLPALETTGLLQVADDVCGPLRKGFYGLRATLLMGVFRALLGSPARRVRPDSARLTWVGCSGWIGPPEVKTLRRKLAELAAHGRGADCRRRSAGITPRHAPTRLGSSTSTGHVRVYSGARQLPKTHTARMRIAGPATEETWVGDGDGDPVMVLTAAPSQSLAAELHRLLPDLRALVGADRRCTVVFDRGGYSPAVFAEIIAAGFDVLTYYKVHVWPARRVRLAFTTVDFTAAGQHHPVLRTRRTRHHAGGPWQREYHHTPGDTGRHRDAAPDRAPRPDGHQTPILTNRTDLTAAQVAYRMGNRWRQENYFEYAREHFALDALDSYADHPDDPPDSSPTRRRPTQSDHVAGARADLNDARADMADALDTDAAAPGKPGTGGKATVDPAADQPSPQRSPTWPPRRQPPAPPPRHLPLGQVRPGSRLLETERKLAHPRHPDVRLQQRECPARLPSALPPQRTRRPRATPRSVHPPR